MQFKESEIDSSLKTLQEESRQLVELAEMEKTYASEVVNQLKQIIGPLGATYHVQTAWKTNADGLVSDAVLTAEGMICVTYNNGAVHSKPLESTSSETLLKILAEVIPEVKRVMMEKRQNMGLRASLLERIAREIAKVAELSTDQEHPVPVHK